jgi:thiol-disulfide isomerase/thioredoxin
MKRISILALGILISLSVSAQTDAPYLKHPTFPPVKLLMTDSTTWYTKADLPKKKPVMVMVFNPMCDHCQDVTQEIVKNIDLFKDIHIVMATSFYFDSLSVFSDRYRLNEHKNIVVGYDPTFFMNTFYQLHNLPFLAFYNRKKELISVFEGAMPVGGIIKEFVEKRP